MYRVVLILPKAELPLQCRVYVGSWAGGPIRITGPRILISGAGEGEVSTILPSTGHRLLKHTWAFVRLVHFLNSLEFVQFDFKG
jgi:hypothetical protein